MWPVVENKFGVRNQLMFIVTRSYRSLFFCFFVKHNTGSPYAERSRLSTSTSQIPRTCHRIAAALPEQSKQQSKSSRIPTIKRSPVHTSSKSCPQSPHEQKPKTSHIPKANGGSAGGGCVGSGGSVVSPANIGRTNIFSPTDTNARKCGFDAFLMTGDLILNLSRNQQSADILTTQQKKVNTIALHTRCAQSNKRKKNNKQKTISTSNRHVRRTCICICIRARALCRYG